VNADRSWETRPHRRRNALTGEWILVSPQRTQRPWQGETTDAHPPERKPAYDPECYLCPGNSRAGGAHNPAYTDTFVFDNDYAALALDTPAAAIDDGGLLVARSERGICRVVCFTPRHDLSIAQMPPVAIRGVIDVWAQQYAELGAHPDITSVTIFENHGEAMGASNPAPARANLGQRRHPQRAGQGTIGGAGLPGGSRSVPVVRLSGGVSPNPRNFRWPLPGGSISPEVLEPIWSEFGIAGGVLDVAVPQVMLDRPRVLPVVG
jgi:hypothetical protein